MPKPQKIVPGIYGYLTDIYRIFIGYLYYEQLQGCPGILCLSGARRNDALPMCGEVESALI